MAIKTEEIKKKEKKREKCHILSHVIFFCVHSVGR